MKSPGIPLYNSYINNQTDKQMNFHSQQRKGFVKGGGTVYSCRVCGRLTRPTGTGDNDGVQLCVECYDLAGEENSMNDNGEFYGKPENILADIAQIVSKGGDASSWADIKEKAQEIIKNQVK